MVLEPTGIDKANKPVRQDKAEGMKRVGLHLHTNMSAMDGMTSTAALLCRAAQWGHRAMAITDHGAMYGVIDFYRAAKEAGIKPILGCEVYVAPGSRFDRETESEADRDKPQALLAAEGLGCHHCSR